LKVLLDSCVWGPAANEIRAAKHDVKRVEDWPADPGDEAILSIASQESRVLVTLDKDFGELAIVRDLPHAGIIRLVGIQAIRQATACLAVLDRYGDELTSGAIVTVEPGRVRVRASSRPPIGYRSS
jgi:predicted nuclease of predicted toxin-antitoxin system